MQRKALLIDYEYCIGCCQCDHVPNVGVRTVSIET